MGLFSRFKSKDDDDFDPLADLTLSKLKTGYYLEYDMKTWEVTAHHFYDYGDGYNSEEWQLKSADDLVFLERYEDDEVEWTLCRKIPMGMIDGEIRKYIREHEDPPEQVVCKGETYYLDESGPAYFSKKRGGETVGFLFWTFLDEQGEKTLTIEQWDEDEFEACLGEYVEEYQFTNILPGSDIKN